MFFSFSNAVILAAALALNVASTWSAPIPSGGWNQHGLNRKAANIGSNFDSRDSNYERRIARESALKAIRYASDILAREFDDDEERSPQIGRRDPPPYSAHDLEPVVRSALLNLVNGGTCACLSAPPSMRQSCSTSSTSSESPPSPGQPGAAPTPGQPGTAPTPGQPGHGSNGTDTGATSVPDSSGSSMTYSSPTSLSTGTPDRDGDVSNSTADNSTMTDSVGGSNSSSATGNDGGDGDDNTGNDSSDNTEDEGSIDGGDTMDGNTTASNSTDNRGVNDTATTSGTDSSDGAQTGRSLFERWLVGRTSPAPRNTAKRLNSAHFRSA